MSAARITALEDRVAELETEVKTLRRASGSGHSCELLARRLNVVEERNRRALEVALDVVGADEVVSILTGGGQDESVALKARIQRVLHGELGLHEYRGAVGLTVDRCVVVSAQSLQHWIDVLEGRA